MSKEKQLWLIEKIVHRLQKILSKPQSENKKEIQLVAMAVDPEIQRELKKIEEEFSGTEQDGLGQISWL